MTDIREVVARVLRLDPASISDESAMRNTPGWDSLAHMNLVMEVEATYDVRLSMDDIVTASTVAGLRSVLQAQGKSV